MHNKRQITIIKTLLGCKTITIKELAILCNASYKSIQNDIRAIRKELLKNGAVISTDSGQGIALTIQDEKKFRDYYDKELHISLELALSNDDYCNLFLYLLAIRNYVRLEDFTEMFYISRAKTHQVLKNAKEFLEGYLLEIDARPRYGLYLKGDEIAIRQMLADILYKLKHQNKLEILENLELHQKEVCSKIQNILSDILEKAAFAITDASLYELKIMLFINGIRSRLGRNVVYSENEMQYLSRSPEYSLAKEIAEKMEEFEKRQWEKEEIVFLVQLLSGRRKYELPKERKRESSDADLERIIEKIINRIEERFGENFHEDLHLYTSLMGHFIPLLNRIRSSLYTRNPLLLQIRKNYPFAFEMGIESACVLYEESGVFIDENEIAYLAVYFETAMERRNVEGDKKKILIVCSTGGGLAQLLALKVKNNFASSVDMIETTDKNSLKMIDVSRFDYVFSAVPLEEKLPVPCFEISSMLSKKDIKKMEDVFRKKNCAIGLADILSEELFFTDIKSTDKNEVIQEICIRLQKVISLPEDFEKGIYEREKLAATELGNFVAFPHPLNTQVERSFMSVTVLNAPIIWEKEMVQVIFLGMTKKGESGKLQKMYQEFAELVTDDRKILKLIKTKSFLALKNLIEK